MKKRMICLLLAACVIGTLTGCGKKKEEAKPEEPVVQTENEVKKEEPKPKPEKPKEEEPKDTIPEGKVKSYLTGEWIDEELAKKRPLAIMIGNTKDALPQYGISSAKQVSIQPPPSFHKSSFPTSAAPSPLTGKSRAGHGRSAMPALLPFTRKAPAGKSSPKCR